MMSSVDAEIWGQSQARTAHLMSLAKIASRSIGIGIAVVAGIALTAMTSVRLPTALAYAVMIGTLAGAVTRHFVRSALPEATSSVREAVAAGTAVVLSPDRAAKLLRNSAVLVEEAFIRAERRAGRIEFTTQSIHDVPDEFKGGRDLWFRGWGGGDPQ